MRVKKAMNVAGWADFGASGRLQYSTFAGS